MGYTIGASHDIAMVLVSRGMINTLTIFAAIITLSVAAMGGEFYELRSYQLNSPEKAAAFDKMMAAAIPVLTKSGVTHVGVFRGRDAKAGDPNWRYVLSAAGSLDTLARERSTFASDEAFLEQARDYLSYEKSDPAFARISVATFAAFKGFTKLIKPADDAGGERFFELRNYESHSEYKAFMKVKMFDEAELDIFADVGLRGVFFGSALSGDNLPNLTYMLVYDNEAEKKKAWATFLKAPAWQALKGEEIYKDTVSKITSRFLVATAYSTIR
jgi:hypothetical protein